MAIEPVNPLTAGYTTGWLAPNGNFFPCPVYEHSMTATAIIETYYPDLPESSYWDGYQVLYDRGYIHIGEANRCDMGYGYSERKHVTQRQIDMLFDLSINPVCQYPKPLRDYMFDEKEKESGGWDW